MCSRHQGPKFLMFKVILLCTLNLSEMDQFVAYLSWIMFVARCVGLKCVILRVIYRTISKLDNVCGKKFMQLLSEKTAIIKHSESLVSHDKFKQVESGKKEKVC